MEAVVAPKLARGARWRRPELTSDDQRRLKELERENRDLKRGNEIIWKVSEIFAQAELDHRPPSSINSGTPYVERRHQYPHEHQPEQQSVAQPEMGTSVNLASASPYTIRTGTDDV